MSSHRTGFPSTDRSHNALICRICQASRQQLFKFTVILPSSFSGVRPSCLLSSPVVPRLFLTFQILFYNALKSLRMFLFISRLNITFLFEKQLTAFNIEESAKSCLTLSKGFYVYLYARFRTTSYECL